MLLNSSQKFAITDQVGAHSKGLTSPRGMVDFNSHTLHPTSALPGKRIIALAILCLPELPKLGSCDDTTMNNNILAFPYEAMVTARSLSSLCVQSPPLAHCRNKFHLAPFEHSVCRLVFLGRKVPGYGRWLSVGVLHWSHWQ